MPQVDLGKFPCTACDRQYPWKPEYAGRKVKCKCGSVLTAPAEPPAPSDDDDLLGGLYDLAEQEQRAAQNQPVETGLRCPGCQSDLPVGTTLCPSCNFNLKTGLKQRAQRATAATGAGAAGGSGNPMLAYAGANKRAQAQSRADNANAIGGSELKELYIPAALVLVGLLLQTFLHGYVAGAWRGLAVAVPAMGLSVLFNVILSFVGIAIVAKLLDLGFGSPGPAITKLVAICLVPPAIAQIIGNLVGGDSGFVRQMIPAIVLLPIAEVMFVYLFDLAFDEAIYTAVIIYLVNQWVVIALLSLVLSGSLGGIGGGTGHSPSRAVIKADETAAEMVDRPNATEARAWLNDSGTRMYAGGETHDSSLTLVNDLYTAGAKKCTTLSDHGEGYALIVQLPTKDAARHKAFAIIQQHEAAAKVPPEDQTTDEGQAYHTFEFSRMR